MIESPSRVASVAPARARGNAPARAATAALLVLAVAIAYLPALSAQFIYDDLRLVNVNPNVRGIGAALRAFFEPLWAFEHPNGDFQNAFWRPLTVLVIALGRSLSGLEPGGYHAISVALHAAATLAAWRLAARLTRSELLGGAVGLFFALHPVHVESVAWISAVNDPLYGLFALLSVSAHVAWRDRGSPGRSIAAACWLLVALLAKEQALAVVPIVLVIDLALGELRSGESGDPFEQLARAYGPMLAAIGVYYAGRVVAYRGDLLAGFDQVAAGFGLSLARSWGFRLEMFGSFVALLFAPVEQAVFRMVRAELPPGYAPWTVAVVAALAWATLVVWALRARARGALAMLLAIPASVSLLLARFQSAGGFPISDRYLYVPVVFAGVLVARLAARHLSVENAATLVGVLALALGVQTVRYERHFHDEEAFFRRAVAVSPDLPYVRWGLGRVLLDEYKRLQEREILDEAAYQFAMALKLGTDYGRHEEEIADRLGPDKSFLERTKALTGMINGTPPEDRRPDPTVTWTVDDRVQANMGMGWCAFYLAQVSPDADYDWPKVLFEATVGIVPDDPRPRLGLGTVLMQMGRLDEAEKELSRCVQLDRSFAEGWHNLAECLRRKHRWDDARKAYEEALRLRPGEVRDLVGVIEAAINAKRHDIAQRRLDEARALHPGNLEIEYLQGVLTAARGDLSGALAAFDEVLAHEPEYAMAHLNEGKIFVLQGKTEDAIRSLAEACRLMPESFEAHRIMAQIYLSLGESRSAREYLWRSYELSPPDETRQVVHVDMLDLLGNDAVALTQLAELDMRRRDFVHALDFGDRALALSLEDYATPRERFTRLNLLRANALRSLDRYEEAATAWIDCLRTSPEDFGALYGLAEVYGYRLHDPDMAAEYAGRALAQMDRARIPADLVLAMRQLLTSLVEREPLMGPLPLAPDPPPSDDGK